ncbi:reverse transcriptase domain-containing protein [Tanacetum coccineum]|uniref:Reverse transcriptase domain-containing protein n=1 Tax=Tanacetum coccineum TaxID=301880 RepID=A0ABQ5DH82_9ASTR
MIDQGVVSALAARDGNRSTNGEDNHNSGTGVRRTERVAREMFPKESDKIERYVSGLPDMIHGNIIASRPKTMQDAIEMATELMDKKISTLAERQAENKRKLDNNNQSQQQSPKRQNVQAAPQWAMNPAAARNQRTLTCYECGDEGHYRSDCPELKNRNHGNQAEGTRARRVVHALRGGETDQDPNNIEDEIEA